MTLSTRAVVIDDTNRDIRYTGEWFQDNGSQDGVGNFGPTYLHTLHGTNSNGSLAYTFQGTSVRVFGTTKLAKTPVGMFDPAWECFVDNISIGSTKPFEFAENNWLLCVKDDLADGQHEIAVNVNTAGQTFWFDKIQYTPSSRISLETAVVFVDNLDPGIILDSHWQALGGGANMTQSAGSTATFVFTGTRVSWVGFVPQEFPHNASSATFSVDGGLPVSFPLNGLLPNPTVTRYNQMFFTTPELPAGLHSLVVIHQGGGQQTPLTLNYLYITNTSTPNASPISSSTLTNSFTTTLTNNSTPTTSTRLSSTTIYTTFNPTPQPGKDRSPIGVIVGSVIGGISLVTLTLFFFWWFKRGQHNKSLHELQPVQGAPGSVISLSNYPFSTPRISSTPSRVSSALSGYNLDTIIETRAMRKYEEAHLRSARHPVSREDYELRSGGECSTPDILPA